MSFLKSFVLINYLVYCSVCQYKGKFYQL